LPSPLNIDEIGAQLWLEAGYGEAEGKLGSLLWHAEESRFQDFDSDRIAERAHVVLDLIQQANLCINGPRADNRTDRLETVPTKIAYSLQELFTTIAEAQVIALKWNRPSAECQLLSQISMLLSRAWSAVLAGDISDVIRCVAIHTWEFDPRLTVELKDDLESHDANSMK
jgi:hypothetical protein